jgi:hypothetical protein
MGGSQQFDMPIDYHHVCEYVSCIPVSSLICLLVLTGYSFKFQHLHPDKEPYPEWISCLTFPHSLCSRYVQRGGNVEVVVVRVFSCCPSEPALTGPEALNPWLGSHLSSGTWCKLSQSASSHVRPFVILRSSRKLIGFLCIVFLARILLKSRSGIRRSDRVIGYLIRTSIQTGVLATAWAIAGLATWFLLSRQISAYRLVDLTSGTVYTNVSRSSSV